ncbi:hypothetical protein AK812_SmicGene21730 [Symbiodinium microadriaticum]|uniref:Uncharacterized protein n=1 Tax=Symbiodinium microadriaticum TaxID=2951 RepID=A0A1Q9DLQ6_SYMMI|nr:hypothetical protein AK812_SmicGene21730 [Symbiodinium microadriaticum]
MFDVIAKSMVLQRLYPAVSESPLPEFASYPEAFNDISVMTFPLSLLQAMPVGPGSPQPREGDFISSPQASFQYVLAASFSLSLLPWRPVGPLRTAQLWMGRSRHAAPLLLQGTSSCWKLGSQQG